MTYIMYSVESVKKGNIRESHHEASGAAPAADSERRRTLFRPSGGDGLQL